MVAIMPEAYTCVKGIITAIDLSFIFCSHAPNRYRVVRMTDHLLLFVTIALAGLVAVIVLGVVAVRALRRRETQAADKQLLELARLQTETAVRIEAMRDVIAGRQAELHRAVKERLDSE